MPQKRKIFYGDWMIVVAFLCVSIYSGCGFYGFSLFVKPLEADFGWGRGEIMVGWTIFFLIYGLTAPFIGRVVDRYGPRMVISIGALIAGLGFGLLSLMQDLWLFYIGYALIGVGSAGYGAVPATALISNWFRKRRGTAIGIMATGIGAGGLAIAPLVGGYLIPNFGWRTSYLSLALIICAILIPLALLVVRTRPADMGLFPDGAEAPEAITEAKASPSAGEGLTLKVALGTSAFWLIAVSYCVSSFSQVAVVQNQVPYLQDIGFPVATAVTALGTTALGSLVGKFFFGWLCDRIQAKYACAIGLVVQAAAFITIMSLRETSPLAMVWLYAMLIGLGMGSWMPTMSILVSTSFGLASYGAIFGMMILSQSVGVSTGPLMAGYMHDIMNTYSQAFIICLALYAIAIPTIMLVRRPKSP